jgi:hypothetical protein
VSPDTTRPQLRREPFGAAWSKALKVGGVRDSGYSLYVDINYVDDSHDWGFHLPFDPSAHGWQAPTPRPLRMPRTFNPKPETPNL